MKNSLKRITVWLSIAAVGGALVVAPVAAADTNPTVPSGTDSYSQYQNGEHNSNAPAGHIDQSHVGALDESCIARLVMVGSIIGHDPDCL